MLHMREQLLRAVLAHAQGEIEKHKVGHPTFFAFQFQKSRKIYPAKFSAEGV